MRLLQTCFCFFGIKTEFIDNGIHLTKIRIKDEHFGFDFSDCPDLAQTIAVVVSGLQIPAFFNGLQTLRIKETDRITALKNELKKINTEVEILNNNSIKIVPAGLVVPQAPISTYEDHRMALAFAAFAMVLSSITIEHPNVTQKSYPGFWDDLKKSGFIVKEV